MTEPHDMVPEPFHPRRLNLNESEPDPFAVVDRPLTKDRPRLSIARLPVPHAATLPMLIGHQILNVSGLQHWVVGQLLKMLKGVRSLRMDSR
ncbi:hypothetical protein GCM10012279_57490 [Micromonospora yangpuensis]|nr:hypothetical protein GCM10012279_57490 [Micromonospora yangpuensis]